MQYCRVAPDRLPDPGPDIKSDVAVDEAVTGFVVEYLSKVRPDLPEQ